MGDNLPKGSHHTAQPAENLCFMKGDCICIPAKALGIVWGNDRRYWRWIDLKDFEFDSAAELLQVNWIEVTGKLKSSKINDFFTLFGPTTCEIFWVVKFNVDAFGWSNVPIKFRVSSNGHLEQSSHLLEPYRKVTERWYEIRGGTFTLIPGKERTVEFGMFETDSDWWKGSMVLAGVKIKVKSSADMVEQCV